MKDILYIGPYRESSPIGNASRKYIQSLDLTTNNIAIRPFYNLLKAYPESRINSSLLALENKSIDKYDVVIQHAYPHQLCYNSKFKQNIAILHPECFNYGLDYLNYIDQMDTIIVPSEFSRRSLVGCGIDQNKVYVVPVPLDTIEIDSFKSALPEKKELKYNKYTFYVMDDFLIKSNIEIVILSFLILSSKYKSIELIIKRERSHNFSDETIKEIINNIYSMFPRENNESMPLIISGDTEYSKILDIHNNANCLIDISSGKSFGYSVLEAMTFNNNIICLNDTAQSELIEDGCGFMVDSENTNCLDDNKMFFMYNTVRQVWSKPILNDLINTMEKVILESDVNKKNRIKVQDNKVKLFSTKNISEVLEKVI